MRKKFRLPTTITNLIQKNGQCVAHSLDFDIVAIAPTEQEAWDKLQLSIKTYVEFGLSKGWDDYIYFPAPKAVRDQLRNQGTRLEIRPPLELASDLRPVVAVRLNEDHRAAS